MTIDRDRDPDRFIDWTEGCALMDGVNTKSTFQAIIKRALAMGLTIESKANSPSKRAPTYYRLGDIEDARTAFRAAAGSTSPSQPPQPDR